MSDEAPKFQIFRAAEAPTLQQTNVLRYEGMTPVIEQGLADRVEAGVRDGSFAKILFNAPGFSLAYAWHKSAYPLPLHSHDVDCLYLVLAGELRFGKEVLGKGDGAFVPADTPYTFVTGDQGVEFLEFRNATSWNIIFKSNNPASWVKSVEQTRARHGTWVTEPQPEGFIPAVA